MPYVPRRIIFEEAAMNYPIAQKMWKLFNSNSKVTVEILGNGKRIAKGSGMSISEAHRKAKRTLVVGIRKTTNFQTCKPSAHYQLPLVTGCSGSCEYCYLNTQFGKNPYVKIYVNVDQILERTAHYIEQRRPETTIFEGAATSDPVAVEPYTGALANTINFFAAQDFARFRFVTKFTEIDSLLNIDHRGKTTIRFSINANYVVNSYEHGTPALYKRIEAANKVYRAGYPLGFIIGPIILFEGWMDQYDQMFKQLQDILKISNWSEIAFEVISHRFTSRAKKIITEVFPDTTLPMDEYLRKFKYGQFGYGKYVYPIDQMGLINVFFTARLNDLFPGSIINYII